MVHRGWADARIVPWRMPAEHISRTAVVSVKWMRCGTEDGVLVSQLGQTGKLLADLRTSDSGRDRLVGSADALRRVRLHVERIHLSGTTVEENEDAVHIAEDLIDLLKKLEPQSYS